MQTSKTGTGRRFIFAEWATAFLVVVFLSASVLFRCPKLHELLHADAESATHVCFLTLLAKEHVAPPDSAATLFIAVFPAGELNSLWEQKNLSTPGFLLPLSRGPPSC